jgi:hypothetical protein
LGRRFAIAIRSAASASCASKVTIQSSRSFSSLESDALAGDALGELSLEVNALADLLSGQRAGEIEAVALLRRVVEIALGSGVYFEASNSSFLNNGVGILASASNLLLHGGTISESIGNGMTLRGGSIVVFRDGATITGNGGNGVHLEDASFAGFQSATVTGNLSGLDVDCAPQFTITHFVDRTGGVTNCFEPTASTALRQTTK